MAQSAQSQPNPATGSNFLLFNLLAGGQPPLPPSPKQVQFLDELPHCLALILPDSIFHVKLTVRRMTEWFTASSYGELRGTYTSPVRGIEDERNFVVMSWMNRELLDKHWSDVMMHAVDLQQQLHQECIGVIRDGRLVLVRSWG